MAAPALQSQSQYADDQPDEAVDAATGADSGWSSTSSAESELDAFWHDSPFFEPFHTTQDTANTLDSFDFSNDALFPGSFDSCSTGTGLSDYQTQDSAQHMTHASAGGVEAVDFAPPPSVLQGLSTDMLSSQQLENCLDLSSWSCPTLETPVSSLTDRLSAGVTRGDGGRAFIPHDALRSILLPHNVFNELQKHFFCDLPAHDIQCMAETITRKDCHGSIAPTSLLRTFAVLLLLDKADKILDFSREGLCDTSLPFRKVKSAQGETEDHQLSELRAADTPSIRLRCFEGWSQHDLDMFEKAQWHVVVPVLSDTADKQVDFLELDDKTVLPFIESWQGKGDSHYKGGNSEVWKVRVHAAHHTFQKLSTAMPSNPYFAIKKLKSKDDDAFRREVRNLRTLHNAEHPHLLNLLATYKYRGYYHLVFPWADSDLRRLWRSTPRPQAGMEEMRWLAQQCASIASALQSVHAGAESWMQSGGDGPSDDQRMAMNKYGIHGDIKPENIFIFSKGQHKSFKALAMGLPNTVSAHASASPGAQKISSRQQSPAADDYVMTLGDFGGGEFFHRSSNPDPLRQITVAYRPPEHDTKLRPVSRSWDVWGLGCTFLEFATWFLLGPSGLTEFAKRRTTRTAAGKLSDEYFDTFADASEDGGVGATLKEPVLAWINGLCRHKNASPFIRDFLQFITHRMFIVENASLTRASADEVSSYLTDLVRKCFDSDDYCSTLAAARSPWWRMDSKDNSFAPLPSSSPNDLADLDFTAATEDVADPAWSFPSLADMNEFAQWNTAPIMSTASYPSLDCDGMLANWNFTAPVSWDMDSNSSGTSPTASVEQEKKRKRGIEDVTDDVARRVSPKTSPATAGSSSSTNTNTNTNTNINININTSISTSLSPDTTRSSSAADSPVVDAGAKKAAEQKFACPYYKNNPVKFRHKRTCCGPGWPTVHRVKEHLYRCHTIGRHICSRCLQRCKGAAELLAHQRAAVSCATISDAFPEGTMLPSQEEVLRVKRRVPADTTEASRWGEIYMVLFPEADAASLPTPFYEDDPNETRQAPAAVSAPTREDEGSLSWLCSPSDYERYLSSSLPPRVRQELERQIQHEFGFFGDEQQTQRMVDMVQQLQLRLFRQFRGKERNPENSRDGEGR